MSNKQHTSRMITATRAAELVGTAPCTIDAAMKRSQLHCIPVERHNGKLSYITTVGDLMRWVAMRIKQLKHGDDPQSIARLKKMRQASDALKG